MTTCTVSHIRLATMSLKCVKEVLFGLFPYDGLVGLDTLSDSDSQYYNDHHPNDSGEYQAVACIPCLFIVADQVNITWEIAAPVISLYESCGSNSRTLEATRRDYVESGCNFILQPFTAAHEPYGNNITSVVFGVSRRYTSDPSPISYNFANHPSLPSSFKTAASTPTLATITTSESPKSTTTGPSNSGANHGLSTASKIGIGLGIPLGALSVIIAVGSFILYRRRKQQEKTLGENSATVQSGDGLAPLPAFDYRDKNRMRLSQTESMETMPSQLSSDCHYQRGNETDRPLSELMSVERVELS
ncbi:predicted protein [Aspergillus terreus NIH2624]|uniref:Mid2 domain-containing protein n=1 Tax=Aspergillus terreus (strain NIH 2624 / FGSC A1156) TaxID=341663 RepID=Q0C8S5_ASPTN|nr:uncharacterized protein ATEG_09909 [Aspergillus terreus NIH2624]EAU30100.1 predicted protein [Aspergillus terreus NIH2624]